MKTLALAAWLAGAASLSAAGVDIRSVAADLVVPPLVEGDPAPGRRVRQTHPDWQDTAVCHILCLPENWNANRRWPVIVEFAGNGPFRSRQGDVSTGRVEGSNLGYGISAGRDYIWLCLPYLDGTGRTNVTQWWGTKPAYDPEPTLRHALAVVRDVSERFQGDTNRLVLCGFSRGAIACNYLGLHNDEIAPLWRAFIPYSHYDGVKVHWPYPDADRESALIRLRRLKGRPQFVCGEGNGADATREWIKGTGITGDFTFTSTGFVNHNDAWVLRPSAARTQLRQWLGEVLADGKR